MNTYVVVSRFALFVFIALSHCSESEPQVLNKAQKWRAVDRTLAFIAAFDLPSVIMNVPERHRKIAEQVVTTCNSVLRNHLDNQETDDPCMAVGPTLPFPIARSDDSAVISIAVRASESKTMTAHLFFVDNQHLVNLIVDTSGNPVEAVFYNSHPNDHHSDELAKYLKAIKSHKSRPEFVNHMKEALESQVHEELFKAFHYKYLGLEPKNIRFELGEKSGYKVLKITSDPLKLDLRIGLMDDLGGIGLCDESKSPQWMFF